MEIQIINNVFIYFINKPNKVIGKLENVYMHETLRNIRPKIKKMKKSDEFVKPMNVNFDIFDKDMEEVFV